MKPYNPHERVGDDNERIPPDTSAFSTCCSVVCSVVLIFAFLSFCFLAWFIHEILRGLSNDGYWICYQFPADGGAGLLDVGFELFVALVLAIPIFVLLQHIRGQRSRD